MVIVCATPVGAFGQQPVAIQEAQPAAAIQEAQAAPSPTHGFLIAGFGSAGWNMALVDGRRPNDFSAAFTPVLLFQVSDRFLFESELEFTLEDGITTMGLEYAQIDYSPLNNLKVVAGKFLLPFNVFSERLHPSWINKFVSPPPLYGHGRAGGPASPLLPILSDVGVQLRSAFDVGRFGYVTADAFVTQGPNAAMGHGTEEADHEADEDAMPDMAEPDMAEDVEIPEVAFGRNFADNNPGKMFGGRIGAGLAPYFEINVSAMGGDYDDAGQLRFSAYGAHAEGRFRGTELHGEWVRTAQQVVKHPEESGELALFVRHGFFVQAARRIRAWEPAVRWTQIFGGNVGPQRIEDAGDQLGFGLAYWLSPSVAVKTEFLVNFEDANVRNNRLAMQWAFGF